MGDRGEAARLRRGARRERRRIDGDEVGQRGAGGADAQRELLPLFIGGGGGRRRVARAAGALGLDAVAIHGQERIEQTARILVSGGEAGAGVLVGPGQGRALRTAEAAGTERGRLAAAGRLEAADEGCDGE